MKKENQFLAFVLEQMAGLGSLRSIRMFGGYGIYRGDLFFALVLQDELYFKADEQNVAQYEAVGSQPFQYEVKGKTAKINYYRAPDEVLDDPEAMLKWAKLGLEAAERKAAKKAAKAR